MDDNNISRKSMKNKNNKFEEDNENDYLNLIIEKYDFIEAIFIIDLKGNEMCYAKNKKIFQKLGKTELEKLENLLNYEYNIISTQNKNKNLKSIVSFYNNFIIYQKTINEMTNIHFICNKQNYNHEIVKFIIYDLSVKINLIYKELENVQ